MVNTSKRVPACITKLAPNWSKIITSNKDKLNHLYSLGKSRDLNLGNFDSCIMGEIYFGDDSYVNKCMFCHQASMDLYSLSDLGELSQRHPFIGTYYGMSEKKARKKINFWVLLKMISKHMKEEHPDIYKRVNSKKK